MRKRLKKMLFLVMVICAGSALCAAETSQGPAVIGISLPLTGNLKAFGLMMKNSFEMAKESLNETGGINGHPLEIVFADDQGKTGSAESVFGRLVRDSKAVMLTGGYASDPTYHLAKLAEKNDIPFLICTASADKITREGWKNIFRLNPPVSEYTDGLEDFWIKNFRPVSMAVIYENSMFGTDGAMQMMEFCQDKAVDIRAHVNYDKETAVRPGYFRVLAASLTENPPDVIYMISYLEDAVALLRQIREMKISALLCGGGGGFTLDALIGKAGKDADHLLTAALWSKHVKYPGAEEYYARYTARYGNAPDYHGAEAYSALMVACDALRRARSFSPKDIRDALNRTCMKTPFGPVRFYAYDGFERQNSIRTLVLQIINGKFETVWPPDMASSPFVLPGR